MAIRSKRGKQFTIARSSDAMERATERLDISQGTHGTTMFDEPTQHILPSDAHGSVTFPNLSDASRAYYTAVRKPAEMMPGADPKLSAEESGWHWAQSASLYRKVSGVRPRPVVHAVTPEGSVDLDMNLNDYGTSQEMTADRLRITDTSWTPPPSMYPGRGVIGVQGTIPHVNWNQFGPPDGAERNFRVVREERPEPATDAPAPKVDPRQRSLF